MSGSLNCGLSGNSLARGLFRLGLPAFSVMAAAGSALGQGFGRVEEEPGLKDYFFKLLRSPFGTLLMIFAGLGGFAMLYMQREGKAGDQVPIGAILLILGAIVMFILRVMITSGVMGQQYLDWN